MRKITGAVFLVGILAGPAIALAQPDSATVRESIVQVAVLDGDEIERLGSGFAVAEGYVLTAAHLVANEDRIIVVPLTTGAELVARTVYLNERADVALLGVNGLSLPPLKFAVDGFELGRPIFSAGVWSDSDEPLVVVQAGAEVAAAVAEGSVGKHSDLPGADDEDSVPLMEHNAMIPAVGYGGPALNECGEVAGLNRGAPGVSAWRLRRGQAPEGVVYAVRVSLLAALLQQQGTEFIQSEESCVSALAAARSEAEEAAALAEETRQQLAQSRQELEEAAAQAEETEQRLEQAQQEKEQAAARVVEAETRLGDLEAQYEEAVREGGEQGEQAETLRAELEAAREEQEVARGAVGTLEEQVAALEQRLRLEAEADKKRLIVTVAIASALVLAIVIVAFVVARRRSRQLDLAREEAARARLAASDARARPLEQTSPYPDCLLTGETGDGNAVSVKIPGALLGGDGAIIGRSPRNSTLLIDDPTLSREHARLFGDEDVVYLEDLKTTNGTRVNGRDLVSGTPNPVGHGDSLELGAVKVELLLQD